MPRSDLLGEIRREGYTLGAIWRFARGSLARVSRGLPQHPELVRPIAALALVLFTLQFGAALLLSVHVGRSAGVSYLVASSLMLLFGVFAITMLRFVSIPAIVLLIREERWAAVVWLFAASAFTDVLDGVLARALRAETRVGALLDPLTDVAFNSCVFIALLEARVVPWWVTALMLIRYALLVGGTVYLYFFYGPVRIQPTLFGKLTGFLTTLLLGLLLLGLSSWSESARRSMKEVFDVGLGVMGLATIIQVVFIGLANRSVGGEPVEVPEIQERPAKVVGEIRSR